VKQVVEASAARATGEPPAVSKGGALLLAGEIAQLDEEALLLPLNRVLESARIEVPVWVAETGALAYALGAWDVARGQARRISEGIKHSRAQTVIADGPETAWGLTRIYPALGVNLPEGVSVELLSVALSKQLTPPRRDLGKVFVHDSRPACLIAERTPSHLAILPGYVEDEAVFGEGPVYEAPRQLVDLAGGARVHGVWTRALAKTSGADDGLWLTYPHLAAGLASQRLDYARGLGATELVADSPLAAVYLARNRKEGDISVRWLPELLAGKESR
jgi:Fe-S oxidoreductase